MRDKLRELLRRQSGEYNFMDFKEAWPEKTDLARHILAFANTGSGCVIVGVAEREDKTFDVRGLEGLEDKTSLKDAVKKYVPNEVLFEIHDFEYTESEYNSIKGKRFQALLVVHDPKQIPILSLAEGTSIKRNKIYIRANNNSTEADHQQVQGLIAKRLAAEARPPTSRDLADHIAELEALYEKTLPDIGLNLMFAPFHHKAEFYRFIRQLIAKKQARINQLVEQ